MKTAIKKAAAAILGAAALSITLLLPASAAADTEDTHIYDYSLLLTDSEKDEIDERIQKAEDETDMNICVVLNNDIYGTNYDYQDYADVFYEEHYGINTDGVCLFVRFDPNYVHFSTSGKGQKYYNNRTDSILDNITPSLQDHDIVSTVNIMCQDLEAYAHRERMAWLFYGAIGLVIGLIAGLIILLFTMHKYKNYGKSEAMKYLDRSKTVFKERNDVFIREYTTKTKISSDSGGGGGGGSHTSSGGGSHGGGGRSF